MNYKKIYQNIVKNRIDCPITDGYCEEHHIIPYSLGGTNDKDNLVLLTAREHYLCHYLLTKIYIHGTPEWCKMIKAFAYMSWGHNNYHQRYVNSRFYESIKQKFSTAQSIAQSGSKNSQYDTMWIFNEQMEINKKISKNEVIPIGWQKGKVSCWKTWKTKKLDKEIKQKQKQEEINRLREIMYYYRDNDVSMRQLCKTFNVGHNVYTSFERYFKDEYYEIVNKKPRNSNITKGRYKV